MTTETKTTLPRGGMCSNPFGGNTRIDRIDFFTLASGSATGESLLYLSVVSQAANDYLYFGLGHNGTTAEEFWFSYEYFFATRSSDSQLGSSRNIQHTYVDEVDGIRVRGTHTVTLTDAELESMCFDQQYGYAGLDKLMPIDLFVTKLEEQRLTILAANWDQVVAYLVPFTSLSVDNEMRLLGALVRPNDPDEFVAALNMGGGRE